MRLVTATRSHHYQGKTSKVFFDKCTSMDEITSLFKKLSSIATPEEISDNEFERLEFFVVRLYSKTCNTKEVNEASRFYFPGITKGPRTYHLLKKSTKTTCPQNSPSIFKVGTGFA